MKNPNTLRFCSYSSVRTSNELGGFVNIAVLEILFYVFGLD